MQTATLKSSDWLSNAVFEDFEQFKYGSHVASGCSLPFDARQFRAERVSVEMGGFFINLTQCMPRFFEGGVAHRGPTLIFQTARRLSTKVNGSIATPDAVAIAHRGDCSLVEDEPGWIAALEFVDGAAARDWPVPQDALRLFRSSSTAVAVLRATVFSLVWALSASPEGFTDPAARDAVRKLLLAAADGVMYAEEERAWIGAPARGRYRRIVRAIDEQLRTGMHKPFYSAELARELGTNVRTIHAAVLAERGLSLHRYIRLYRLWGVRRALLGEATGQTIKQIALSHGFWHLSEFARAYGETFGELPSATQMRATRGWSALPGS